MKTTNNSLNDLGYQKQIILAELQKQINDFKDLRDSLNPNNPQYNKLKTEVDQYLKALESSLNFYSITNPNIDKPCFDGLPILKR